MKVGRFKDEEVEGVRGGEEGSRDIGKR